MSEKMGALLYTPEAVKIFEHFGETQDVYYLRRNIERFMTMQPVTWRQYLRGRGKKKPFWKVYQKKAAWKPALPVPPGKEEKNVDKGEGTTISGAGVRRTKSDAVEDGSDEDDSSEDGSDEGLSTLDKALLASDAARLVNAVRKKANKKKIDDVASASAVSYTHLTLPTKA